MRPVHVAFTKWGGAAHWTFDGLWLGEDEHGIWVGCSAPFTVWRPGAVARFEAPAVQLFPRDEPWSLAAYLPSPSAATELYVDITTPPVWNGDSVTLVDLDLDVVRGWDGRVDVLDEDEFAEHQRALGYPADIVELAERSCADRAAALRAGVEPFATAYRRWLAAVPTTP